VSRTRQGSKIEKACAVQSELPSCANLEVEDTNCDPEHQDLQTLGVERLGSSPRRLQAGGAAQYCTALVSLHDRRIFRSGRPLWNSLFSSFFYMEKSSIKCRAHTGAWRKEMRFVPARPKTHRPMSASSDYSEFKTVLVLRGRLSKEDNKCPSSPSLFRVPTHPHPRYHKVKPSAIQL